MNTLQIAHQSELFPLLTDADKRAVQKQIDALDPTLIHSLKESLAQKHAPMGPFSPITSYPKSGDLSTEKTGLQLLRDGRVGCLLVAGGQATRLRWDGPKGMFPITPLQHKSLFQVFAEKTLAAGKLAGRPLPLAIMTSPSNHIAVRTHFHAHENFGLSPTQLTFFKQDNLPLLDEEGNLFLETRDRLAMGPDGNGSSLIHFVSQGVWESWQHQGIEHILFIQIDNPLADPFDLKLIGHHSARGVEATIKALERLSPEESVGLIVEKEGKPLVVEYNEVDPEAMCAWESDGLPRYRLGNISNFCFSMQMIKRWYDDGHPMPLHKAHKAVKALTRSGESVRPRGPNSWKFERFIFDILPHARTIDVVAYPEEECFAPLKNLEGVHSPDTVRSALIRRDRQILAALTGKPLPEGAIELAQQFYYPTDAMRQAWRGQTISANHYFEKELPSTTPP